MSDAGSWEEGAMTRMTGGKALVEMLCRHEVDTMAALSTAYATNAPVLCISGQVPSDLIGRGFGLLHEIPDQLGILQTLTKWAARIDHPTQTGKLVNEAFRQLRDGRPRPVGIEIPPDVLALA